MKQTFWVGRMLWFALSAALLAFFAVIQARSFTPATNENDCEGYFAMGRRLAQGEPVGQVPEDPFQYQSHVWVVNHRGELIPKYDPGYPLLIAAFIRLGGEDAGFLVSPVLSAVGLLGCLMLFRLWMGRWPALFALTALVFNFAFENHAGYVLGHAAELTFTVWGAYFLWRWVRCANYGTGIAAGLLLGYAVSVRYTAILMAPAVGLALAVAMFRGGRWNREDLGRALALGISYALVPLLLALYHWRWFGSPFTSGYALCGEQDAFAWRFFAANIPGLLDAMNREIAWFLFPLSVVGVVASGPWHERLMRASWFAGVFVVYAAYYWAPMGSAYFRFFYTLLPLLMGGAFMLVERLWTAPAARNVAGALLLAFTLHRTAPPVWEQGLGGRLLPSVARNQAAAAQAIKPHLEADAVLFIGRSDDWRLTPLDTGLGACRMYRAYRLRAFHPDFIESALPEWIDPTTRPPNRGTDWQVRWRMKVQTRRRESLLALYREESAEGLAARREALIASHIRKDRQAALLLPTGQRPADAAGRHADAFVEAASFETPGAGAWTLHVAKTQPRP